MTVTLLRAPTNRRIRHGKLRNFERHNTRPGRRFTKAGLHEAWLQWYETGKVWLAGEPMAEWYGKKEDKHGGLRQVPFIRRKVRD